MKKSFLLIGVASIVLVGMLVVQHKFVGAWIVSFPKWDLSSSTTVNYRANELPAAYQDRLSDARWAWNNVSPAKIELYRNDTSYGLRVYDGYIDGSEKILATATRYWPWDTYISSATIKVDNSEAWYTGTGTPTGSQYDLQSALTHELGHILAIEHTNASCTGTSAPTMCPSLSHGATSMRSLEPDDQGALNYLYP